jgi:cell wall-associated NlpC family hydrolase
LQGVPYRTGGEDPTGGFDCSGFVQYVFARHHLDLPRTVDAQYRFGLNVGLVDVRGGDLVFFSTTAPGATHVGIAIGGGAFVHAPSEKGVVRIERLDTAYWHNRFVGARRVLTFRSSGGATRPGAEAASDSDAPDRNDAVR